MLKNQQFFYSKLAQDVLFLLHQKMILYEQKETMQEETHVFNYLSLRFKKKKH